jgi:hypothetical protein
MEIGILFSSTMRLPRGRRGIIRLLDDTAVWKEGEHLKSHVVDYFSHLFTSEDTGNNQVVLDAVHPRVTLAMNEMLSFLRRRSKQTFLILVI